MLRDEGEISSQHNFVFSISVCSAAGLKPMSFYLESFKEEEEEEEESGQKSQTQTYIRQRNRVRFNRL